MKIFLIDKSVEGVLSALYVSFTEKILPDNIEEKTVFHPHINALAINISTNPLYTERVKKALFKFGGSEIITHIKICLKSNDNQCLFHAFNYGYLTLQAQTDVSNKLNNKIVSDFSLTLQKVLHERQIMTGLLQFKESTCGILYAKYSPDNDITDLLSAHFIRRLGAHPFIIHDIKRNVICMSNGKVIKKIYNNLPPNLSHCNNDEALLALWKKYYKKNAIKDQTNLYQKKHFSPRRYGKYAFETLE